MRKIDKMLGLGVIPDSERVVLNAIGVDETEEIISLIHSKIGIDTDRASISYSLIKALNNNVSNDKIINIVSKLLELRSIRMAKTIVYGVIDYDISPQVLDKTLHISDFWVWNEVEIAVMRALKTGRVLGNGLRVVEKDGKFILKDSVGIIYYNSFAVESENIPTANVEDRTLVFDTKQGKVTISLKECFNE